MARSAGSYIRRTIGGALLLTAIVWMVDWAVLRAKISGGGGFGQIQVHRRFAIQLKNRQVEERMERPHPESCVQSMFSHYDQTPCWYLARHANDAQSVDGSPWHFWSDDRP